MDRTVRRELIDKWLKRQGNSAVAKLALVARVSTKVISEARVGHAPKKQITRQLICDAIGATEESLFPLVSEKERAARKKTS